MLNDTLQRVLKAADYFGKTLYQLRAQLIVSALAFFALSGVGELRQLYRNIVLENNDGSYGFTIAVVSVVLLSGFIWLSSVITLFPNPNRGSRRACRYFFTSCARAFRLARKTWKHLPLSHQPKQQSWDLLRSCRFSGWPSDCGSPFPGHWTVSRFRFRAKSPAHPIVSVHKIEPSFR